MQTKAARRVDSSTRSTLAQSAVVSSQQSAVRALLREAIPRMPSKPLVLSPTPHEPISEV
jgi:hypothetical protein